MFNRRVQFRASFSPWRSFRPPGRPGQPGCPAGRAGRRPADLPRLVPLDESPRRRGPGQRWPTAPSWTACGSWTSPIPRTRRRSPTLHLGGGFAVALAGNLALVAAADKGLAVIDVTDPKAPVLKSLLDTPGQARDVAVDGSVALVADGPGGIAGRGYRQAGGPEDRGRVGFPGRSDRPRSQGQDRVPRRRERRIAGRRSHRAGQAQVRRGPRHRRHRRGRRAGRLLRLRRGRLRRDQGRGRRLARRAQAGRVPGRVGLRPQRLRERQAPRRRLSL